MPELLLLLLLLMVVWRQFAVWRHSSSTCETNTDQLKHTADQPVRNKTLCYCRETRHASWSESGSRLGPSPPCLDPGYRLGYGLPDSEPYPGYDLDLDPDRDCHPDCNPDCIPRTTSVLSADRYQAFSADFAFRPSVIA